MTKRSKEEQEEERKKELLRTLRRGPDLDRFIDEQKRTFVSYAQGARMYSMNYYSFVKLAKEAGANIRIKKNVVIDLELIDKYLENNCESAEGELFNLLCEKADDMYGGRLPVHVRCLIDEAANIGQIPNLEKLMATIRSREISAALVLQAKSQLKAIYKDNADTIEFNRSEPEIGTCDMATWFMFAEIPGDEIVTEVEFGD